MRLLVPNATDVPFLKLLSRTGYRALLEAGVRIFEWNGTMLHAKTAVADDNWGRVGSTNLNITSWFGNYELDVVIEDEPFARQMEEMYLQDLINSTEVVLMPDKRCASSASRFAIVAAFRQKAAGTLVRAAAGAIRIGNVVGAAFTGRRVLESVEARLMTGAGALLLVLAVLFAVFPRTASHTRF